MSWTASASPDAGVAQVSEEQYDTVPSELDEGSRAQFEAARAAVDAIIAGVDFGERGVKITLNGHANPEPGNPPGGTAQDTVSVSVSAPYEQPDE